MKILSKLKNSFLTNLPWKIAAFFMAFVLWFLILNVEDPIRNDFLTATLQLRNEQALLAGEGIHIENIEALREQEIRFQVRGTSRNINAIRNSIGAYIDLSTSDIITAAQNGETLRVTVQPFGYGTIEMIGRSNPHIVDLIMDTITTVEMFVELEEEGEIAEGYHLFRESISITPDVVAVTGPTSVVNRIVRLVVTKDVDGATSTISHEDLPILALDVTGQSVTSQHLVFENTADIELPILLRGRVQILAPIYDAQPPEGFGIHSINWDPQWFDVAGEEYTIENLAPIMLDAIPEGQIAMHTAQFEVPYDIRAFLPPGVFLINPMQHTVMAEVFVEPFVEQDFTISAEDISIIGMPPYANVITEEITITLSALQSIMAGISNFTTTAVVTGMVLEEGYNEVPLVFALPARVSLVAGEEIHSITIYVHEIEEGYEAEEEGNEEEEEGSD